jgi:hypothetical protein
VLTASQQTPEGVPLTIATERMEEFSPGLDKDLLALPKATAEMEMGRGLGVLRPAVRRWHYGRS